MNTQRTEAETQRLKWRELSRYLRQRFPAEQPVAIVSRPIVRGDIGLTTFDGNNFRIRVKVNQDWDGRVDTLLHEWAHILAIEEAYNHKGRWAEIYGEIYESYDREFTATLRQKGLIR